MKFFSLFLVLLPISIYGFDTGHHYDATRNGLELRNFTRTSDSIPIVQLCNYIADWDALAYELDMPNFDYYKQLANLLHFSNLFNSTMVRDYWVQFITNQHNTVKAILNNTIIQKKHTNPNDNSLPRLDQPFLLLCTLGYTLHATQDFYTHSNYIQSLVNDNMLNNNITNLRITTNGNDTCYYTANVYHFMNDTKNDYNLHTYYYPEKYKDQVQPFFPNTTLMEHGYYLNGINKDSYGRMDWDMAYASAFMATIDVIDTWKGWINNDTLWGRLQTYSFTGSQAGANWQKLDHGLEQEFEISNYVKIPFMDATTDGHWKGPNSGQFDSSVKEAADWIRDDWQWNSPFQRAFYDTDISERLTYGLNGTLPGVDSELMIPNVTQDVIRSFNATKLGLVTNDPSEYVAITVRTWGAGKWKTTPSHSKDQDVDGWYAIVGIDGQEFREATQYQGWVHPYWTSMRFIPANQSQVVITYNLMNYADDSIFSNDRDIEAVIRPDNSTKPAQDGPQDVQIVIPRQTSSTKQQHIMKVRPVPNQEMLLHKGLGKAALIRERFQLRSSHRFRSLNHRDHATDGYTYRDEINPDVLDRHDRGVVFVLDTKSQQVVEGLPWFYLNRTYLDVNHTLILQGVNGTVNVAQVNVTLTARQMCSTNQRQVAGNGEESPAPVAGPTPDHWGAQPTGSNFGGAYSVSHSWFVMIAVLFISLVAQL